MCVLFCFDRCFRIVRMFARRCNVCVCNLCMYVCICMYVCLYIYICVDVYVYMYVCMYACM